MVSIEWPTRESPVTRVFMNDHQFGLIIPDGEFYFLVAPLPKGKESILSATIEEIVEDWKKIRAECDRIERFGPTLRLVEKAA